MRTRRSRPTVHLEAQALDRFEPLLRDLGARSVFLVADSTAFTASGARDLMRPALAERDVFVFDAFASNPQLPDVERGLRPYRDLSPDLVVAVGGGSAIDMAKLIRLFGQLPGQPSALLHEISSGEFLESQLRAALDLRPPLIAIPTTAGTGSESTEFAVVYHDGRKHSVDHASLLPDVALIDPQLTYSQPPTVTAAAGLDALCQGIESIWEIRATPESMEFAAEAVSLAVQHLVQAVHLPDPKSRGGMARSAHLAGKAINISRTTACHALSYTLTSRFDVPHGFAVALTLPSMLIFNSAVGDADCCDPLGCARVRQRIERIVAILECPNAEAAAARLTDLMTQVDCPTRLRQVGLQTGRDLATAVDTVNQQRLSNNPRRLPRGVALALLESIL